MHASTVQEDRSRHQRGCTQPRPLTEGHAGVRAIEQCAQKGRDAFCTPQGPAWLRAYAPSRSHRRPRRVSSRCYRAEPQDDGAASSRPTNKGSPCGNCVRGLPGRSWCFPISLRRPARNKSKAPPIAKPTTQRHFSTASTHFGSQALPATAITIRAAELSARYLLGQEDQAPAVAARWWAEA